MWGKSSYQWSFKQFQNQAGLNEENQLDENQTGENQNGNNPEITTNIQDNDIPIN